MRIGERGQVTIPKELREKFGFLPDTEVEFVVKDGGLAIVKKGSKHTPGIDELFGVADFGKTTDELMKLLRE